MPPSTLSLNAGTQSRAEGAGPGIDDNRDAARAGRAALVELRSSGRHCVAFERHPRRDIRRLGTFEATLVALILFGPAVTAYIASMYAPCYDDTVLKTVLEPFVRLSWLLAARAQQARRRAHEPIGQTNLTTFVQGLRKLGWIDGQSLQGNQIPGGGAQQHVGFEQPHKIGRMGVHAQSRWLANARHQTHRSAN